MERARHSFLGHLRDEPRALRSAAQHDGEEMRVPRVPLAAADDGSAGALYGALQLPRVQLPDPSPARVDPRQFLELGAEPRRAQLAERVARSHVHPGVTIDDPELEATAVGPFFAQLLGPLDQQWIADDQGPAYSAADVLRFVEADRSADAKGAERDSAERGSDRLRRVLDHRKGTHHRAQLVQVAGVPAVVHRHYGAGAPRQYPRHLGGIEVPRCVDVREDGLRPPQHESVRGRGNGVGGDDHLVAGANPEQHGGHLESVRGGGDEQRGSPEEREEQFLAAPAETTTRCRRGCKRLEDPRDFGARQHRPGEGNVST